MLPETIASGSAPGFDAGDLYPVGLVVAGAVLLAAVVALSQQRDRAFSAAVVYLVLGAAVSQGLRALGVDLIDPLADAELIEHAAEFAVIVALFSAGVRLDRPLGRAGWRSTIRLIAFAMPLTIAGIALFANVVMGLSLGAAIVLGAVLAPTDPVLAGEVRVGPPGERDEPEAHFALTSEAGLNDGLAFPFVLLGLLIAGDGSGWLAEWAAADVVYAIAVGVAIGAGAGRLLSAGIDFLRHRDLLLSEYDAWLAVAGVLVIYGLSELLGAYGFLAAFAGGLAFRRRERDDEHHERVHTGADTVEKLSELALVLLLGTTVTLTGLAEPGVAGWLLAPVLLLAIRPASVLVSLAGAGVERAQRAFIAWFGVRGIGSFYYAAVAIGAGVLSAGEAATIFWTVVVCTGVSIIAHGVTASPAARRLERAAGA